VSTELGKKQTIAVGDGYGKKRSPGERKKFWRERLIGKKGDRGRDAEKWRVVGFLRREKDGRTRRVMKKAACAGVEPGNQT